MNLDYYFTDKSAMKLNLTDESTLYVFPRSVFATTATSFYRHMTFLIHKNYKVHQLAPHMARSRQTTSHSASFTNDKSTRPWWTSDFRKPVLFTVYACAAARPEWWNLPKAVLIPRYGYYLQVSSATTAKILFLQLSRLKFMQVETTSTPPSTFSPPIFDT